MRRAALDIGSQSILLLIADLEGDRLEPVREEFFAPRLGEGLAASGRLSVEAMALAERDIVRAVELCGLHGAQEVVAVGTAAVREAANGNDFVSRLRERLGIEIKVLSGVEEAELTYCGALSGSGITGSVAVLDVGGGSTECTVGIKGKATGSKSAPVGAVLLSDRFGRSPGLAAAALSELGELLAPMAEAAQGSELFGVGGSATTLASVKLGLAEYDPESVSRCSLTPRDLDRLIGRFRRLEVEEIRRLPGIDPTRADIIEAGATIIRTFLELAGAGSLRVSARGLRYGLLLPGPA